VLLFNPERNAQTGIPFFFIKTALVLKLDVSARLYRKNATGKRSRPILD
jgi:hypothetical protein